MCEARMSFRRMLRSNECLRRMSSTGWEIEIEKIREAVIELVRHHMKCVIPKGHRLRRHPLRGHHNVLCHRLRRRMPNSEVKTCQTRKFGLFKVFIIFFYRHLRDICKFQEKQTISRPFELVYRAAFEIPPMNCVV